MSDFNTAHNRLVWFDIPVADLDRAIRFYGAVLGVKVSKVSFDGMPDFAVLEHEQGNGGCLVTNPAEISAVGTLIYLNADGRIRAAEAAVSANGGRVVSSTHPIGPHGFRAIVLDSEGNRLALHSHSDR
jgi:uncharacterized protein